MKRMLRQPTYHTLCSCFLLLGFLSSGIPVDVSESVYQKEVSEVRLTFYATDQRNRTVTTISKSDLAVVDSGEVIRNIRSLQRADTAKLDIILLIDCSESVLSRFRHEFSDALQIISQSPWLSDDRVSVITFCGPSPSLLGTRYAHDLLPSDRFLPVSAGGDTPLYDAIDWAGKLLENHRQPEFRSAILLFSDGLDSASRCTPAEALNRVLQTDTQIYTIDLNSKHSSSGTQILHVFAESSGGRYLRGEDGVPNLIATIIDDLHSAYLLTYDLPNRKPGYHQVRLLPTHDRNLRFRCRQGYFFGDGIG